MATLLDTTQYAKRNIETKIASDLPNLKIREERKVDWQAGKETLEGVKTPGELIKALIDTPGGRTDETRHAEHALSLTLQTLRTTSIALATALGEAGVERKILDKGELDPTDKADIRTIRDLWQVGSLHLGFDGEKMVPESNWKMGENPGVLKMVLTADERNLGVFAVSNADQDGGVNAFVDMKGTKFPVGGNNLWHQMDRTGTDVNKAIPGTTPAEKRDSLSRIIADEFNSQVAILTRAVDTYKRYK